jgi:dienelactone hydrolase
MRRTSSLLALALVAGTLTSTLATVAPAVQASVSTPSAPATVGVRDLPDGWSWDGTTLVWTSDALIMFGGGRAEFRLDDVVIGYPREEGRALRLDGATEMMSSTGELSVWRSGRRLDADVTPNPTPGPDLDTGPAPRISRLDPAARGRFETARRSYRLDPLSIRPYPQPVEMVGEVTSPVDPSDPMPLVLVLHGRHGTCFTTGGEISGDWPCPSGWRSVPSHQGYRDTADALASQGHIVVSISANGINAQDSFDLDGGAGARSQLVRAHLTQWATWNTRGTDPWGGRFEGRIDLDQVVLVGHSRGGEGVARAAIDTRRTDPWAVRGLVLLAPTAFTRIAAPQADTVVVLPACDGDVSDLQGQQYLEVARDALSDGALRSTVLVPGANHNFFNAEWTPGISRAPSVDDAVFSNVCTGRDRLSPGRQRAVGRAYTAALVRLVTRDDPSALALLDGRGVAPPGIGDTAVSVTAIGGAARLLVRADETAGSASGPIRSRRCVGQVVGVGRTAVPDLCLPPTVVESPHWLLADGGTLMPPGGGSRLDWSQAGGAARFRLRTDLRRADSIDLRVVVPRSDTAVELAVRVRDADGDVAVLGGRRVPVQRHGWLLARHVRVPLRDVPRRIDLARIRAVEVVARSTEGTAVILDIWARRRALPRIDETPIPVISVQSRRAGEGSSRRTIEMSLDIRGEITRPARVWVQVITPSVEMSGRLVVLRPGAEPPTIVVPIEGNTLYDGGPRSTTVAAFAMGDVVVARTFGGAIVAEDDAAPSLTIEPLAATATEGNDLTWTLRLSEPVSFFVGWGLECRNGVPDPIASTDVTSASIGIDADPAVLLCDASPTSFVGIEPGETEATVAIGTLADALTEPAETATFVLSSFPGDPITPDPIELSATIEASP